MEVAKAARSAALQGKTIRRLLRRGGRGRISKLLARIRPADVAIMLQAFTPAEQFAIFQILREDFPESVVDLLTELEQGPRVGILEQLTPETVADLLESSASDDAVFLLDSLPEELREKVLAIVDLEPGLRDVQAQLVYDDDTAGRIMSNELMALPEDLTVAEATERIRGFAQDVEMISYLYIVDQAERLVGVAPLRNLLLAQPEQTVGEIMNRSVISVHTTTDQEEVAQLASRYDLLAIPVVDDDHRVAGIVTIDDIVDVVNEEANEDFFKMAGTTHDEVVYQDRSWKVAGIRLPWILFNLVGLLGAGVVVSRFEETFQIALLIGFIPVIMGMAGNIGSQTSTIAVRGLATGSLSMGFGAIRKFTWQQLKVGVLLGLCTSSVVGAIAYFLAEDRSTGLALSVALSLFVTVQLASLNGVLIPVLFQRLGFDPAVASGPLVTTANDVLGVLIYFSLTFGLLQAMAA